MIAHANAMTAGRLISHQNEAIIVEGMREVTAGERVYSLRIADHQTDFDRTMDIVNASRSQIAVQVDDKTATVPVVKMDQTARQM